MNLSLFGKNAVIYAAGIIALRASALLLVPVYVYSLSMADYGLLSVLLQTGQLMVILMGLGSRTSLVRFSTEYENRGEKGVLIGSSIVVNLIGGLIVSFLALVPMLPLFRSALHTETVILYVILTCSVSLANCLCAHLTAYYRAGNDGMRVVVISLTAALLIIFLSIVAFSVLHLDIVGALLAQTVTYTAMVILMGWHIRSKVGLGFSWQAVSHLLRFGTPLIVLASTLAAQTAAIYFLSYFGGLEQVAVYSLGMKFGQIGEMIVILPFQMAYEPFIYGQLENQRLTVVVGRLLTYLMTAYAFAAFAIVSVARGLLPIIAPPKYSTASVIIFLILPIVAFRGVYYVGESLLLAKKKSYFVGCSVLSSSIIGVLLSYATVARWGMYGAVAAYAATTIGMALLAMTFGIKAFPAKLEPRRLLMAGALLVTLLTVSVIFWETPFYVYYTVMFFVAVLAAGILFFGGFLELHERLAVSSAVRRMAARVRDFRAIARNEA